MFKKLCAILMMILGAGFFAGPVMALEPGDIVMSLNPSELELDLEAGKTYEYSVDVTNAGRLPFDVITSVSPYYAGGDNYEPDFENMTSYTKLYSWITLEQDSYHLEPGETAQVGFTVKVPTDVVGGGQYAAIMLLGDSGIEEEGAVKVQGQLAAILYGHVDGVEQIVSGELVNNSLPAFMFNDQISVSQTVKNTGNVDFRVKQIMTITDYFSNRPVVTADTINSEGQLIGSNSATVLPGTTRTGILTWTDAPKLGLFEVKQEVSFLDQDYVFTQVVFLCPLWLLIIVLVIVIAVILRIIYKIRQSHSRRHKAPEASDQ